MLQTVTDKIRTGQKSETGIKDKKKLCCAEEIRNVQQLYYGRKAFCLIAEEKI